MESIFTVTNPLFPSCYMATVDLRFAYLHVPIHQKFQNFLRLAVRINSEVLHFRFWALPFGLSSSPRIFTKVLAEALALLRVRAITVIPYLDDLLFVAPSFHQLERDLQEAQSFLPSLGWLINQEKSQLTPAQEVLYLGYKISSVEMVFLPREKILKVDQAVSSPASNQSGSPSQRGYESSGSDDVLFPSGSLGKTSSAPSAESHAAFQGWQKTKPRSTYAPTSKNQKDFMVVGNSLQSGSRSVLGPSCNHSGDKRHQDIGMGCPPGGVLSSGSLVTSRGQSILKSEGASANSEGCRGFLVPDRWTAPIGTDRQCGGCRICEQAGRHKEPRPTDHSQQDSVLSRGESVLIVSHSPKRLSKFTGRFSQPPACVSGRMVPQHKCFQGDCTVLGTTGGRPLCLGGQQEGGTILFHPPTGSGHRDRRLCQSLAVQHVLCLSSSVADSCGSPEISGRIDGSHPSSAILAKETLVCQL